jgi:hypothetical protein
VLYSKAMVLGAMTAAGGLVLVASPVAEAAPITELQFDLNCLSIQATSAITPDNYGGFTGALQFSKNVSSDLALYLDGLKLNSLTGQFEGISGQIGFQSGNFLGGDMVVTVKNADLSLDTYSFHMAPSDSIHLSKSAYLSSYRAYGYQLNSDTSNGAFSGNTFGGVDVTVFHNNEPLTGAFMQLKYRPDANGLSNASDVDIFTQTGSGPNGSAQVAAVPLPSSVWGGLVLAGLLGAVQYVKVRKDSRP